MVSPVSKASQSTEMGGKIMITAFYPNKWDLESEIVQGSSVLLFIQLQILSFSMDMHIS